MTTDDKWQQTDTTWKHKHDRRTK